ncbi:hypothetical protein WP12_19845 [Sphingomonas sp. SRS2]|nr:hypothetical protein WP12_19845 [Sphingomonas sp. SRS2]
MRGIGVTELFVLTDGALYCEAKGVQQIATKRLAISVNQPGFHALTLEGHDPARLQVRRACGACLLAQGSFDNTYHDLFL